MIGVRTSLVVALLCALLPLTSTAHEIRPGLLEIRERATGWVDVTWKVPTKGDRALALEPLLPASLTEVAPPSGRVVPGAWVERTTYRGGGSLVGETISIKGLSGTQTDVLLRVELADGSQHSTILRPAAPSFQIPEAAAKGEVAVAYWRMGVIHILEGVDHLLFLLALLMLVRGARKLIETVTAFTLAHSATLALATLGVVHVPPAPTEAVIALSIVFLACEIVRLQAGEPVLTARRPWLVALAFGLFHGLGFAGALSEIGVPANEVPLALVMFNVGVETGQLLFVGAVLLSLAALRRLRLPQVPAAQQLVPYAIGALAAFWTIERTISSLTRGA